jgi:predicted aminopeptidase
MIPTARHVDLLLASALLLTTSCSTVSYYTQAARGHLDIVSRQTPIDQIAKTPSTGTDLQRRLALVEEARRFAAAHLGLRPGRHYTRYADLGRDAVVYNVYAAPEFSLEPKRWWYPFIGRQSYRGFFRREDAEAYARELRETGHDVHVGGVDAYSTLGWFRDPVLNTWINEDDEDIVALVFHELTHQRVYVAGDTRFNEAYATAVEIAGVKLWLESRHDPVALARWNARQQARGEFIDLTRTLRTRLKELYASDLSSQEMRSAKQDLLDELQRDLADLRQRWKAPKALSSWSEKPVNNARLNTISTYHELVPTFLSLLERHHQDFTAFHRAVKEMARLPKERRLARLKGTPDPTRNSSMPTPTPSR